MVSYDSLEEACRANFIPISSSGDCSICQEPYNSTEIPIQHIGSDVCSHVFGESCLTVWFDTLVAGAQTPVNCPYCRQYWFDLNYVEVESDEDVLEDTSERYHTTETDQIQDGEMTEAADDAGNADDPDDADYNEINMTTSFEHVRDRDTANILVEMLYTGLRRCRNNAVDRNLRACVERAILDADLPNSLPMTDATWEKIKRTIKRMHRDSKKTQWDDDTERNWVRRMVRVLPWKFRR